MNDSVHTAYKKNGSIEKKRKKRHELSISATRSVSKHDVKIKVIFE